MIRIVKLVIKKIKNLFNNKYRKGFDRRLRIAPHGCDLNENLLVFRYLCHQLDKTIKNPFDKNNIRGLRKYNKAKMILIYLQTSEWKTSSDVIWGSEILNKYELWKENKYIYDLKKHNPRKKISKDLKEIVYNRRSVRFWKKTSISIEILEKIIEMGIMAPSSCNRQPWKFVIVENTQNMETLNGTNNKSLIEKAPYIIYISIDRRMHPEIFAPAIDAGLVTQNILLAIEYYGYKGCPVYQCESINQKRKQKSLNLSKHDYIYVAIPLGLALEVPEIPVRVLVNSILQFIKT